MISKEISIKDGANLNLKGLAVTELGVAKTSLNYALNPDDFFGLNPRMLVKEGDKVSLGQPIFHDKNDESIKIVSPVSGKVIEIVRGAKRKILNIIIKKEGDNSINFKIPSLSKIGKDVILQLLVESGSLAFIRQRPYNIIARPSKLPKSIFVSTHSTAPYAADYDFILRKRLNEFQIGIDMMSRLIGKPINLSISQSCEIENAKRIEDGLKHMVQAISLCPGIIDDLMGMGEKVKKEELGVEESLINLKGMTQGMLVILGQKNIKKILDFADLSSDELIGGFDEVKGKKVRIEGYLEEFSLSRKEADQLIMSAREIAYK